MRIVVTVLAAVAFAGLACSADAASSNKKKHKSAASKERIVPQNRARNGTQEFGFDATPEHYPVGSREWWLAMHREGRGGTGGTP